jgi:hypothetical protein
MTSIPSGDGVTVGTLGHGVTAVCVVLAGGEDV